MKAWIGSQKARPLVSDLLHGGGRDIYGSHGAHKVILEGLNHYLHAGLACRSVDRYPGSMPCQPLPTSTAPILCSSVSSSLALACSSTCVSLSL